jgi:molecular chaperone GrpE
MMSEQQKDDDTGQGQATLHDAAADTVRPEGSTVNGQDRKPHQSPETEILGDDEAFMSDGAEPATGETAGEEMASIIAQRDDYLDQLQRSRADFANYRRRSEQERTMLRQLVSRDVLSQFLPVIDDLERALAAIPEKERDSGWVKGVSLIQSKLKGTIERLGVTKIDALNKPFDPAVHEAVSTEPGTSGNTVVEVYQSGYRLGDILVRPAMVKTGDAHEADPDQAADASNEQHTQFNA